jgi:hypothetical protein
MIHLRVEHLAALEALWKKGLIERVHCHVVAEHAEVVSGIPEPLLMEMVESGIARARGYGMRKEASLTSFVSLMFAVAPNFDQQKTINRVLSRADILPDERISLLDGISERHWKEARNGYDERAWFPESDDPDADPTSKHRVPRIIR